MKIAITSDTYPPMTNGVATFCRDLALGLAHNGHQVLVIAPSHSGQPYFTQDKTTHLKTCYLPSIKFHFYHDQIHPIPAKTTNLPIKLPKLYYKDGLPTSPLAYHQLKEHLDAFQPDVIHNHVPGPVGWSALYYAKTNSIPFISTGHSYPDNFTANLGFPKAIKRPIDTITREYLASIMRLSDYATFPAKVALKELFPRHHKIKTAIVPNGVDLSRFSPAAVSPAFYKKYHLPTHLPIVAFIGRIDKEKNIDILIAAFQKVLETTPSHLLLVGDGNHRLFLEKLVAQLDLQNHVTFTGRTTGTNLTNLMRLPLVYATASTTEVQSIAILEAMACGQPIVAVNAGPMRELCRPYKNGYLCRPSDLNHLAKSIKRLLQDKRIRHTFSQNSLRFAQAYDIRHSVTQFEKIYRQAISLKK